MNPSQITWCQYGPIRIKRNQITMKIRPKVYPIFQVWPKFRLSNPFQHNRGRRKISNFSFRLNRNRIHELVFGFGSGSFKSNFVCYLSVIYQILFCFCVYCPPPSLCFSATQFKRVCAVPPLPDDAYATLTSVLNSKPNLYLRVWHS